MRDPVVTRTTSRGRRPRKDPEGDTGSVVGQPAQVQISCQVFACVRVGFRWAVAVAANITGIVPPPTNAERRKIVNGLFGAVPLAPLELPAELDVQPCIFGCQCVNVRWGAWTPTGSGDRDEGRGPPATWPAPQDIHGDAVDPRAPPPGDRQLSVAAGARQTAAGRMRPQR